MSNLLPLMHCWRLYAKALPDNLLLSRPSPAAFTLPGAQDLSEFAELLGGSPDNTAADMPAEDAGIPFALPALLPNELSGEAELRCDVDFGALRGDNTVLTVDHLCGSGCICLGDQQLAAFDSGSPSLRAVSEASDRTAIPCALAIDLTDALRLGRKETLSIRFDAMRPAGLCGPVLLQTARHACLSRLVLTPDPVRQIMSIRAQINAMRSGTYLLRILPISEEGTGLGTRELSLHCEEDSCETVEMAFSFPGSAFSAGASYHARSLKITLLRRQEGRSRLSECDSVTLMCGYPGRGCEFAVPLTPQECALPPDQLVQALAQMHIPCVRMGAPASDTLYRAFMHAGIAVRMPDNVSFRDRLQRLPCVTFSAERINDYAPVSLAGSAWQMGSIVSSPRTLPDDLSDSELLEEIAGHPVDANDPSIQNVLRWLRAVAVRLRAEAARQGRFQGALCAPGEWRTADIADSLRSAFAPVHVSALPLCGAWWSSSRFSAVIHAFVPAGTYTADDPLIVTAALENEDGQALSSLRAPCRARGGAVGVLEAQLPASACVLQLVTRLTLHGATLCESCIPVYVGERGPLEAAFA